MAEGHNERTAPPTLYADDLPDALDYPEPLQSLIRAGKRVLPRRCACEDYRHGACEDRSWLWPDQDPATQPLSETAFRVRLVTTWKQMRIIP